jgi:hypothetical protein
MKEDKKTIFYQTHRKIILNTNMKSMNIGANTGILFLMLNARYSVEK